MADIIVIKRLEFIAFKIETAPGFKSQTLRGYMDWPLKKIIKWVSVARLLLDFLDCTVPLGDNHAYLRATHFEQRVCGNCCSMGKEFDRIRFFSLINKVVATLKHAQGGVRGGRGNLFYLYGSASNI